MTQDKSELKESRYKSELKESRYGLYIPKPSFSGICFETSLKYDKMSALHNSKRKYIVLFVCMGNILDSLQNIDMGCLEPWKEDISATGIVLVGMNVVSMINGGYVMVIARC